MCYKITILHHATQKGFRCCGCILSHRVTTCTPTPSKHHNEHSQTHYNLKLQRYLTIAIINNSGHHKINIQKYLPLKKISEKKQDHKNNISSKNACTQPLFSSPHLSFMPREKRKTGHGSQSYHPCILSVFPITPQSVELYDWILTRRGPKRFLQKEKCLHGLSDFWGRMCYDVTNAPCLGEGS